MLALRFIEDITLQYVDKSLFSQQLLTWDRAVKIVRRKIREIDYDFVCCTYSSAYQKVVEHQFGAWEIRLQKSAFDEKWHHGGFEVIKLDGTYVGAVWVTDESEFLQLRNIFITFEYQRRRIGSKIVCEELKKARASDMPLRLRVLKQNRAIALYERLGFAKRGETLTQYWMEAV